MISEPRKQSRMSASLRAMLLFGDRPCVTDHRPKESSGTSNIAMFRRLLPVSTYNASTSTMERGVSISSTTWSRECAQPLLISPQEHLNALLTSRGYAATSNRQSLSALVNNDEEPRGSIILPEAHYDAHIVDVVQRDNPAPLRALLDAGVAQNPCNSMGESIGRLACRLGSPEILNVLLQAGCDPKATDEHGRTLLHEACRVNEPNWVVVGLLLDRDVGLLYQTDDCGRPPLSYVKSDNWEVWIQFVNDKVIAYFPWRCESLEEPVLRGSVTVRNARSRLGAGLDRAGRTDYLDDENELDDDSTNSNDSMSDELFDAFESEMDELLSSLDTRMVLASRA